MIRMTDIPLDADDKKKFLIHRYNDCSKNLRSMKNYDFKVAALYIVVQVGICAYRLLNPGLPPELDYTAKNYFLALDFAWLLFSILILFGTFQRQKELLGTIITINDLFDLNKISSFVHAKPINYVLEKPEGLIGCFVFFGRRHHYMRPIMMLISFLCVFFAL